MCALLDKPGLSTKNYKDQLKKIDEPGFSKKLTLLVDNWDFGARIFALFDKRGISPKTGLINR